MKADECIILSQVQKLSDDEVLLSTSTAISGSSEDISQECDY